MSIYFCTAWLRNPRFWVGGGTLFASALAVLWVLSPGIPVLFGPWASASAKAAGQELFEHEWEPNDALANGDGVGPVFNAKSCAACHFQGGLGGGGDLAHNVRTFEVLPTTDAPTVKSGVIHNFAVDASYQESDDQVRRLFPVLKGRTVIVANCTTTLADFDPLELQSLNSTALFGAGWVDLISDKAILNNRLRRAAGNVGKELLAEFNNVPVGRARVLDNGRVGKFGWKAQSASLEDFVATACATELGLGTPHKEQAKPLSRPDYPSAKPDLDRKQFKNLVAFVSTLPRPVEVRPEGPAAQTQAEEGKKAFHAVGCALCHTPDLGGVKGVYSDFLLYTLDEEENGGGGYKQATPEAPLPPEHPRLAEWKTPALWGVADSAPYFHDGRSPTLQDAILRHRGDAKIVTERYSKLTPEGQEALVAFLMTLKAPPAGKR